MVQEDATQLVHKIEEIAEKITHEFSTSDPDIQISVAVENCEKEVLTEAAARKTVLLINLLPNGILRMSDDIKGTGRDFFKPRRTDSGKRQADSAVCRKKCSGNRKRISFETYCCAGGRVWWKSHQYR